MYLNDFSALMSTYAPGVPLYGLSDSGWNICDVDHTDCVKTSYFESGIPFWQAKLPSVCTDGDALSAECFSGDYIVNRFKAPFMVVQNEFDVVLYNIADDSDEDKLCATAEIAQDALDCFGVRPPDSLFFAGCSYHNLTTSFQWQEVAIDGISIMEAIAQFVDPSLVPAFLFDDKLGDTYEDCGMDSNPSCFIAD